jgi:CubicO group peptidase (beta-lactamase class C family)
MRFISLALVLFVLQFTVDVFGQAEKAEAGIQEIIKKYPVVGVSVAVVKKDKIVYAQSFGQKDIALNTPLTNDCLFRIASISKSFSATSIMQLVEAGKLSLDDDVSTHIGFRVRNPKFPETVITLRNLMSHRSSLNDSQGYFSLDVINPAKNPNWTKCYNEYGPNKDFMYCNLNYNIIGTIIEKISGERFDQYVKHHILDPLGLYGGYCVDSLDKSRFATIYEYRADSAKFVASAGAYAPRSDEIANYVMGYSAPIFSPTGGMKISAPDLAKYMVMHMQLGKSNGKKIMSKKSAREMQTMLTANEKENYGLAIDRTDKLIPGKTMTGHTGSAYGLNSAMYFNRKEKFGIVIITNGSYSGYTDGFINLIKQTANTLHDHVVLK